MGTFPRTGFVGSAAPRAQRHRRLCHISGKIRWLGEPDAAAMVKQRGSVGSAYQCPHCASWHLTRQA